MTIDRRTVSLPKEIAKEIEKIAKRERVSFSAAVATLAEEAIRNRRFAVAKYRSLGAGASGLPDLGTNHEKYLDGIYDRDR